MVDDEIVTSSPCKIGNGGEFKGEERPVVSIGELGWLALPVPEMYSALVQVLAWLSVPPGEACALRRSDLNLESGNPTITIRRRVSTKTATFAFDTPKTEAGKRTISVALHLVQ